MRVARTGSWVFLLVVSAAYAQTVTVLSNGVVNSASFAPQQAVSPGSIVSIFGTGFGSSTATSSSIPLSATLANVSVTFNGVPAPLFGVFGPSSQINAQLPWDVLPAGTTTGTVSVVVTANGVASASMPVQVSAAEPGIFTVNAQGTGQAAATNAFGTAFVAPAGSIPGANSAPAHIGDVIVSYANGLGAVDGQVANGDSPRGRVLHTTTPIAVLIGGVPAQVQFSGLNPQLVGLNQINVQIQPGTPTGDAVSLQLRVDSTGFVTSDHVTIAITP